MGLLKSMANSTEWMLQGVSWENNHKFTAVKHRMEHPLSFKKTNTPRNMWISFGARVLTHR